jgi:hypothetical protein
VLYTPLGLGSWLAPGAPSSAVERLLASNAASAHCDTVHVGDMMRVS